MTINNIQINNYIQRNLPTLNAALESETWQKVAFVFLSVITLGILPLSLVLYDLGKNLLNRRQVNVQNNANRAEIGVDANRPDAVRNFSEKKVAAVIGGITGAALLLKVYLKKDFITPIASTFFKGVSGIIKNYPKESLAGAVALVGVYILKKGIEEYRIEKNQPKPKKVKNKVKQFFKPTFKPTPDAPLEQSPKFYFNPIPSAPLGPELGEQGSGMYPNLQSERPLNPNAEGIPEGYKRAYPVL